MNITTNQNKLALKRVLEIAQMALEHESIEKMIRRELDFDDRLMDKLHEMVSFDLIELKKHN
jgi:hypothetical protein